MNLKEKLALKNKSKIGNKTNMGLKNKFKKRNQTVLDKMYEERDERTKSGSLGKKIFNQELMAEFGIEDFTTETRDVFVEVMPLSFDPLVPYCKDLSVHFGVGTNNDAYVCMNRYKNKKCFRCETQAKMWRDPKYTKEETKNLYPTDRSCYLLWERTNELINGEEPDFTLKLWASPKTKVHSEIQAKARNKITRTNLDISDLSDNGDGRTVSFTIVKQGDFPDYKAFDLITRSSPIPNEILEKLDKIFTAAEEKGYSNCIEMFFNIPTYDEIKESMEDEENEMKNEVDHEESTTSSTKKNSIFNKQQKNQEEVNQNDEEDREKQIQKSIDKIQQHLESIMNSPLKWKMWCKKNNYEDAISMNPEEAIPLIVDDIYEKMINDLPF